MSHPFSNLFVPKNLAIQLYELGFTRDIYFALATRDESDFSILNSNRQALSNIAFTTINKWYIWLPFHHQVVDWFREEHTIDICAQREFPGKNSWIAEVTFIPQKSTQESVAHEYPCMDRYDPTGGTHYQALERAIIMAIQILKNRQSLNDTPDK